MKKTLLLFSAALLTPLLASAYVPNILTVTPAQNAVVDEISTISIEYISGYWPEIHWYNSNPGVMINNVPVAGTTSASSDESTIMFNLSTPITAPGEYTITVPENSYWYDWDYEYDGMKLEWTVTIEGEPNPDEWQPIENPVSIDPAQGTYSMLQDFVITFRTSYIDYNSTIDCYLVTDDDAQTIVATGIPMEGAGMANGNVHLTEPVTTPGHYLLIVPEGAFYDYLTDDDEPEYQFRYIIEEGAPSSARVDNVEVYPADGAEIEKLEEIELLYVDYADIYENYRAAEDIEVYDTNGEVVAYGEISVGGYGQASNQAIVYIDPVIETAGTYTVKVPYMTFILEGAAMYDGQYSGPLTLTYTVKGDGVDVDKVSEVSKAKEIYSVDGTRVNAASIDELPAGLYIVDGKKVIRK